MTSVWSDGQAGASASLHDLQLGRYDPAMDGITVRGSRLVQDSRDLEPGDIFVGVGASALPFVGDALARGASAVLVDAAEASGHAMPGGVIAIHGLTAVLGRLADDFTGHPSRAMTMVGITGTNGKTSTAHLLTQAWEAMSMSSATIGTLGAGVTGDHRINMGMTTPQVTTVHQFLADFRARGVLNVAMEVSSHALHQGRVAGVEFDFVVFTNLSRDHLDYHGTMEEYAAQKAKIFSLPGIRAAVVNLDDPFGAKHFAMLDPAVRPIGLSSSGHPDATVSAGDVRLTTDGLGFDLVIAGARHPVLSSLIGRFNVENLLATAGVLHAQGIAPAEIASLLGPLLPVFGRMTRIRPDPALPLVVVDAGHTPDAILQAVTALRESGHSRIVTVFGCTGDRDPGKRPVMARIVEDGSDLVVMTDDDVHEEDGDRIFDDIRRGFVHPESVVEIRDRATAIQYAIDAAGRDDVVLLAGKGHEPYQIIGTERVPFSDIETAERMLRARAAR